MTVHFAKLA